MKVQEQALPALGTDTKERRLRNIGSEFDVWIVPNTQHLHSVVLRKDVQDLAVATLSQDVTGKVPRGYLPAVLTLRVLQPADVEGEVGGLRSLIDESLRWFLDCGGRVEKLQLSVDAAASETVLKTLSDMGFTATNAPSGEGETLFAANAKKLLAVYRQRMSSTSDGADVETISDVAGRLTHGTGDARGSIEFYTKSLTVNPKCAATFRNLGSAYHAIGDMQLAFASYQQALELDPNGAYH